MSDLAIHPNGKSHDNTPGQQRLFSGVLGAGLGLEPARKTPMELARKRLMLLMALFFLVFCALSYRVFDLGLRADLTDGRPPLVESQKTQAIEALIPEVRVSRADIVDRNGEILATNLEASSLFANPSELTDSTTLVDQLLVIMPELNRAKLQAKLTSERKFVWIKRKITPRQKWQVNALGNPALGFEREEERIYPHGRLAAHALGHVGIDGKGMGGVEHFLNDRLNDSRKTGEPIRLSLDIRVQYALADELETAMRAHRAIGGAGLVMDVHTGELIAMVSLPDFDPNNVRGLSSDAAFNRVSQGVYELGSTFKTFTFAQALDTGIADFEDSYDATKPLRISRFTIHDDHPKARVLSVPEIFVYSSNIGTAQIALEIGGDNQRTFLNNLGMLEPANLEVTEVGAPLYPATWRKVSTMTISYGHGIAVSPVQLATGMSAMVNGGRLIPATLIHQSVTGRASNIGAKQVIKANTSRKIRQLLRLAVTKGTGGKANAKGYRVGGKTGTAEKAANGSYDRSALISSFLGVFPMDDPKYVVFALLDEPKGTKATYGFSSGGWTAAPVVNNVILRTAPLLGVPPRGEDENLYQRAALMVNMKGK